MKKCNCAKKAVMLLMAIFLCMLCVSVNVRADEIEADTETETAIETETVTELEDYTELNGWEQAETTQHVAVNPYQRSGGTTEVVYLAVFIEFPDLLDTHLDDPETLSAAEMLLNTGGEVEQLGGALTVSSLKQCVERMTYNKISTTSYIFPRETVGSSQVVSYKASHNRGYYLTRTDENPEGYSDVQERGNREAELISGAIAAIAPQVEAAGISQEQVDADSDGKIDAIAFFVEGGTTGVAWQDLLWPHKINAENCPLEDNLRIVGKEISAWNLISTETGGPGAVFWNNRPRHSIVVHEYGHILGLPDLYRSGQGTPVGPYDVMAINNPGNPQGIMAVMAGEYGDQAMRWHNPLPEVRETTQITVTKPTYQDPSEQNAVKIYSPYSDGEYFVAEYYARNEFEIRMGEMKDDNGNSGSLGIDSDGLLISRMNPAVYTNIDTGPGRDMLYVFRPGETSANAGEGEYYKATLSLESGRTSLGTEAAPQGFDDRALYYSDGSNSGIVVEITGETEDTITFRITVPTAQGNGTEDSPYLISTPADFDLIRNNPEKYYRMENDIDFSGVEDFTPIPVIGGYYPESQAGVLDGNGKTIRNLAVKNGAGLFSEVGASGVIQNLNLENVEIVSGETYAGGVAGALYGRMENVCVRSGNVTIRTTESYGYISAGGIAGTIGDAGCITDCFASAAVSSTTYGGGLVGLNQNGILENSFAKGRVDAPVKGGISGAFYGNGGAYVSPTNVFFDVSAAGTDAGTGALIGEVNGTTTGAEGITAVTGPEEIALQLDGISEKAMDLLFAPQPTVLPSVRIAADNPEIAVVTADSKIRGVTAGTTTATAQITVGTHVMPIQAAVTVTGTGTTSIPLSAISLDRTSLRLNKGEKSTLSVAFSPADTTDDRTVTWTTGNANVAAVTNGKVTAVAPGNAVITAAVNGKTASCNVRVSAPLQRISLSQSYLTLTEGGLSALSVTYNPADTTDNRTVSWSTSNKLVASVVNGKILAGIPGRAVITASVGGKQASCTVQVNREAMPSVRYRTHVQDVGWQNWRKNGEVSGTTGRALRLEGINIALENQPVSGGIQYQTHVQDLGWQGWKSNGEMSGTTGRALRLEAIRIRLTGKLAEKYHVYYRVHAEEFGWLGWASDGASAGTAGYAYRLEGIQVVLVRKDGTPPGPLGGAYRHPEVKYQCHVQDVGWQGWSKDGEMAGTTGRALRLEGIRIKLHEQEYSGDIRYSCHIQDIGWQGLQYNGNMSGTTGRALRLEGIRISLTGEMAKHYDLYYRVHAEEFGWLGWAANGASAGSAGYARRLEGIQIKLVPKGAKAPGSTANCFHQR